MTNQIPLCVGGQGLEILNPTVVIPPFIGGIQVAAGAGPDVVAITTRMPEEFGRRRRVAGDKHQYDSFVFVAVGS